MSSGYAICHNEAPCEGGPRHPDIGPNDSNVHGYDIGWNEADVPVVGPIELGPVAQFSFGSRATKILRRFPLPGSRFTAVGRRL